ncbi:MAG: TIGR02452 family protein [Clostridiales bacterium]|jgi:uncharacterized protein (TIGR02452 family)|nr:TIGR02452 family protein [Clostridiales bacterium]
MTNSELFFDTTKIANEQKYVTGDKEIFLKLSKEQMTDAVVLTDNRVLELIKNASYDGPIVLDRQCRFSVSNIDSFTAAANNSKDYIFSHGKYKQLVLNFANPVEPGGGVKRGAKAQEEDLCIKSTLMCSLESERAGEYYSYHKNLLSCHKKPNPFLSSDYMILSPTVEVFRDENNNLSDETFIVSVLTVAAPYVVNGMFNLSKEDLEAVIFQRIMGILQVSVTYGYKYLVLGAWGCGAFGNDADMVAGLFYKAFREINCKFLNVNSLFKNVQFAVLHKPEQTYNFDCFKKYFDDFYRDKN